MNLNQAYSPATHINLNIRGMRQSATVAINDLSKAMQKKGQEVFKLGLGQSPFPVPDIMTRALQENAHQKDYLMVKGLPELRQSIVDYYQRTQGLDYHLDHVLVGPGSKELMFILQLTYYGDLVIPAPSWVSYAPQARIIGRKLHWLPTAIETGLGVTPEELEKVCETDPDLPRLMILNYPGNPTGMTYDAAQLEEIAEVAKRYRVLILSDEIYGGTTFEGEHTSIARFYPEGTIISNGISKWAGAGGWRMGAFVFPENLTWLLEPMTSVASETFTSTSAPIQFAAIKAYEKSNEMDLYLQYCKDILSALCTDTWQKLNHAGAEVAKPKGGFYLFPSFEPLRETLQNKGIRNSQEMCERLLAETGVACLPGSAFGRPEQEFSARIACVDFNGDSALKAASYGKEINSDFLEQYCYPVTEATRRLCHWLKH
ncbi:pyridoxal phosphate-dependent aminotransferase [Oceanospirillum sediminis]|uniref:Aminotransferase n=1 Tax=Oceanospirillum sediminis TaxID=2760088 RepID=A0A839IW95_9GAMM|nr:aminotransferase class I/II-fold pyridoxal phosphate-dependent enzyme [Oceanospirillum sediminis]MBB1489241.1 aminotransferase class I/II-fold pyridoxal phosphate-dependent enzyme [Oceanospirillum sediminis]